MSRGNTKLKKKTDLLWNPICSSRFHRLCVGQLILRIHCAQRTETLYPSNSECDPCPVPSPPHSPPPAGWVSHFPRNLFQFSRTSQRIGSSFWYLGYKGLAWSRLQIQRLRFPWVEEGGPCLGKPLAEQSFLPMNQSLCAGCLNTSVLEEGGGWWGRNPQRAALFK